MKVAILGASDNPERYAYKAFKMLQEYKHQPIPVNPHLDQVEGVPVFKDLKDVPKGVDTLTVYMRAERSSPLAEDIINLKPRRVIFNPGAENTILASELSKNGIASENACTLVLLRTNQFDF